MKKVSIISFVLGLIGAALAVGIAFIPFAANLIGGSLNAYLTNFVALFTGFAFKFSAEIVLLGVAALIVILNLVMVIVSRSKSKVAVLIFNLVTVAIFLFVGATAVKSFGNMKFKFNLALVGTILYILDLAAVAVAAVLAVVSTFVVLAVKKEKDAEVEEKKEEVPVKQPASVAAEAVNGQAATEKVEQPTGEKLAAVVTEETREEPKVIRHILVHKSGKVIRVLNEHYYDVTTSVYYEPGVVYDKKPTITEAQHYEQLIGIAQKDKLLVKKAAPVEKPAPVAKPAPVVEKQKAERIPFPVRMKKADKELKGIYNEIKNELLSYGIKSRVANSGDTFRLHKKTYAKIVVAGKRLKLYFALNPKDYKDSTFPIGDASDKKLYKEIPLVFKVKSDLSVRRAKALIADAAKKDGLVQKEVKKQDWVKAL